MTALFRDLASTANSFVGDPLLQSLYSSRQQRPLVGSPQNPIPVKRTAVELPPGTSGITDGPVDPMHQPQPQPVGAPDYAAWGAWDPATATADESGWVVTGDGRYRAKPRRFVEERNEWTHLPGTVEAAIEENIDGAWKPVTWKYGGDSGDIRENTRYVAAGLVDPRLQQAVKNYASTPDTLDDFLALTYKEDPLEAARYLGVLNDRGTTSTGSGDPTAFAPKTYWDAALGGAWDPFGEWGDTSGRVAQELGLRGGREGAAKGWTDFMSADAQSKRDDPKENWLATLAPLALSFIPGMQGFAGSLGTALGASGAWAPVVGNALIGGVTSGLTGGDPLKGALSGGLGSYLSGADLAGSAGLTGDIAKVANSAISGGAKQLINTGSIDPAGLLTNAAIGYGSNLAGGAIGRWAGLTDPAAQQWLNSGIGALARTALADNASGAAVRQNARAPDAAAIQSLYQQYLNSKRG